MLDTRCVYVWLATVRTVHTSNFNLDLKIHIQGKYRYLLFPVVILQCVHYIDNKFYSIRIPFLTQNVLKLKFKTTANIFLFGSLGYIHVTHNVEEVQRCHIMTTMPIHVTLHHAPFHGNLHQIWKECLSLLSSSDCPLIWTNLDQNYFVMYSYQINKLLPIFTYCFVNAP